MESDKDYKNAINTAVRMLSRRRHTSYELEQKLALKGFNKDCIRFAISECKRLDYINDHQTACHYYQELKSKGYGCVKIRLDMKKKGISQEQIDNIFLKYYNESEELETARKVLKKKEPGLNREKDSRKKKEKIYRFLSYRGFTGIIISKLIHDFDKNY
ncbi:Regulatory protein [Desulfonema limicola]|uniref:Regulatory protein RecX n=1 Tax=Desulfonema limicola TaxID=45656 RepID=A0A975GEA2_9BACT|nr:regulatory protein RecX [Desulfonema limicola]QTA77998.1 Regulatory protein [Desulfonema limicola]